MYKLEYLPSARRDLVDIVGYISHELNNPAAADRLAIALVEAGDSLSAFPYANPVHTPLRPLKHEYRKILVRNYFMFYRVDEEKQLITVARVIYARRSLDALLD